MADRFSLITNGTFGDALRGIISDLNDLDADMLKAENLVTSITSGSTDAQVPSAKAVYSLVTSQVDGAFGALDTRVTSLELNALDGDDIVTSINASSSDSKVPSAKTVYTFVTTNLANYQLGSPSLTAFKNWYYHDGVSYNYEVLLTLFSGSPMDPTGSNRSLGRRNIAMQMSGAQSTDIATVSLVSDAVSSLPVDTSGVVSALNTAAGRINGTIYSYNVDYAMLIKKPSSTSTIGATLVPSGKVVKGPPTVGLETDLPTELVVDDTKQSLLLAHRSSVSGGDDVYNYEAADAIFNTAGLLSLSIVSGHKIVTSGYVVAAYGATAPTNLAPGGIWFQDVTA